MTETTTPRTYSISTKPREGGRKAAITVTTSDGLKTTKVTGRTYQYIVVSTWVAGWRWDQKQQQMINEPSLTVRVEKGTGNYLVAQRELASLTGNGAAVILQRVGHSYRVWKHTGRIEEVAA